MKLVVLDGYCENPGDLSWAELEALGELSVYDRTAYVDSPLIAARIGDAEIAITNKTPITRSTLEQCPNLRLIAVMATGYNVVDCDCAREMGIAVVNVPTYGTASVAQFAIALLLEVCHHIGHHSRTVSEGRWSDGADWCYWDYPLVELASKCAGIIGFGRIGQATGQIARALGMEVVACDPHPCDAGRAIATYLDLPSLLAQADVVFLHCNLTAENQGLINRDTIAMMKDGAILINNARGQLVEEDALAEALRSGKLAAAALDVVREEPIHRDNPLLHAPNCILTPHMSWGAQEARARIMRTTVENIEAFLAGHPIHVVNGVQ